MSLYYAPSTQEIRELDDEVYARWAAAGNPKAQYWVLIAPPPDPRARYNGSQWVMPPLDQIQAQCIARINEECRQRLFQRFGQPEEQVSRSLGVYGSAERDALAQGIAAMIDASNDASDQVLRATTIADAEAVTAVWPELPA